MPFPNANEDESDFTLTTAARSRLSSLFQSEAASGDVNQALTFQAPKQPKKNDNSQSSSGTFKLIVAVTVHAYKLIDGNYVNQGKLGCAILGIHENSSYKFLIYKGKQIQVTTCTILPTFKFHVQPNNYANFYDEKNENWSLNFDNETSLIEFAKQIALAKANSQGKPQTSLVVQDLTLGEGPSLDTGHSAEVKYTGWLLTNYTFGQVFDSNMKSETAFRLRLGKSKVIKGWTDGLVGARKGSRRILVVPPALGYGAEGVGTSVPPHSMLIFDVLVTKAKASRESSHSPSPSKLQENSVDKRPEIQPRTSISQEDNIRMRGASISEQLTQSPKKDKAQLISRMAKMGTATLPLQGAIPAQVSSESENEENPPEEPPPSRSRTASPKPLSKPTSRHNSVSSAIVQPVQLVQECAPLQAPQQPSHLPVYSQTNLPAQQPFVGQTIAYPPYQAQIPSPYHVPQFQMPPGVMPGAGMVETHLPLLVTETRSQNTEVRMSLAKITDKVDTVIQKVDDLRLQRHNQSYSSSAYIDSALLVQNIERMAQENNQLKKDTEEKDAKIQTLNEKICDLLQRNQGFFEEKNIILEQRNESIQAASMQSQAKYSHFEKQQEPPPAQSDSTSQQALVDQIACLKKELELKAQEFKELEKQIEDTNVENESLIKSLGDNIMSLNKENNTLKRKVEELESQLEDLSKSNAKLTKTAASSNNSELESLRKQNEAISKDRNELAAKIESYEKELQGSSVSGNHEVDSLEKKNETLSKEKNKLLLEIENLKKQLSNEMNTNEKKIQELKEELEDSSTWKKKYEVFYEKMLKMKTKYDTQVGQLTSEVQKLQVAGSVPASSDFSGEIKKVMNMLYKILQGKFESDSTYSGGKVLEMTLQAIRGLTFQMLQIKSRASSNSSEQEVEIRKVSDSGDSDAIPNSSKDLSAETSSLNTSAKEGGPSDQTLQSNRLEEATNQSDAEVNEITSLGLATDHSTPVKEENCGANEKDFSSNVPENAVEESFVISNSDVSSSFSENNTTEEIEGPAKDPQEVKQVNMIEKRTSPEFQVDLLSACLNGIRGKDLLKAFLFVFVVLWIGAWVHDLEASTTTL